MTRDYERSLRAAGIREEDPLHPLLIGLFEGVEAVRATPEHADRLARETRTAIDRTPLKTVASGAVP